MRSSVDAAAFYKAMTALMDIPAKSPVKVLQEIKVEFTADHCTLSATDFGTWLSVTIPASGDDFAFVFWNSAGVQKVCRYFTGQLELELSGQRKSQIISGAGCKEQRVQAALAAQLPKHNEPGTVCAGAAPCGVFGDAVASDALRPAQRQSP